MPAGAGQVDSDVDLLITVPDARLERHDRVRVLGDLWPRCSSQRQQYRSAVTTRAYEEGILM
ncbi:MAG: hypothetical protein NTW02_03100 [Cyanobium sp. LacPavin_0920_WC12_MAG_62_9]|nr:hypothetical protein [Cyanobium sp. LacPavin_0920_WC12_MAG_62_9]